MSPVELNSPHLQPPDKSSTDSDDTHRLRYHTNCVNLLDMLLYTRKLPSLQQLTRLAVGLVTSCYDTLALI